MTAHVKRVLVPLPDRDFDVTEVAVPWRLLTRAGHEVVFATERGARPAADPLLLTGVLFGQLGADPEPRAFYAEMERAPEFEKPRTWAEVEPSAYDALFLPGGHAPGMRQCLGSSELQAKVLSFWRTGRPVAAICHGVLVLARRACSPTCARRACPGTWSGRRITSRRGSSGGITGRTMPMSKTRCAPR